jgi:hypothetical protein
MRGSEHLWRSCQCPLGGEHQRRRAIPLPSLPWGNLRCCRPHPQQCHRMRMLDDKDDVAHQRRALHRHDRLVSLAHPTIASSEDH